MLIVISLLLSLIFGIMLLLKDNDNMWEPFVMFSIVGLLSCGIWNWTSYESALDQEAFYHQTIDQFRGAIELYEDKAIIKINDESITDFKYQGYQENISEYITDLRNKIVDYNRDLYTKNQKEKNPFLNWMNVPIKGTKTLTLIEDRK